MDYKSLFINLLKMCAAGFVTLIICGLLSVGYDKFVELPKYAFELVKICLVGIVCLAVYVELNLLMKMEYAEELFERLAARFKK